MKTKKLFSCLIMLWALLPSCNSHKNPKVSMQLENKSFTLVSIMGKDLVVDSFPKGLPTIQFEKGGTVSGHTGCNAYFGTYSQNAEVLNIKVTGMTKMFCIGVNETAFVEHLQSTTVFNFDKSGLTFLNDRMEILIWKTNENNGH